MGRLCGSRPNVVRGRLLVPRNVELICRTTYVGDHRKPATLVAELRLTRAVMTAHTMTMPTMTVTVLKPIGVVSEGAYENNLPVPPSR